MAGLLARGSTTDADLPGCPVIISGVVSLLTVAGAATALAFRPAPCSLLIPEGNHRPSSYSVRYCLARRSLSPERLDGPRARFHDHAMKSSPRRFELTSDVLLRAYSIGVFPMAESREAKELFWVEPHERGVFPLDGLIVSKSLAKAVRSDRFRVVADRDFAAVIRACAEREKTWINEEILRLYCKLFEGGY